LTLEDGEASDLIYFAAET